MCSNQLKVCLYICIFSIMIQILSSKYIYSNIKIHKFAFLSLLLYNKILMNYKILTYKLNKIL